MSFGSVTVGNTATSTLTIGNSGTGELAVTAVTYPAGFSGTFSERYHSAERIAGGHGHIYADGRPSLHGQYHGDGQSSQRH